MSDDRPLEYVVAIDEAFMIDGIADTLLSVFKKGITVIVSSIQLSANFKPFEEMQAMMPYATKIDICPAVCPETGEDAYYTFSKLKVGHDPVVGGEGMYEPRSFHAHPALTS